MHWRPRLARELRGGLSAPDIHFLSVGTLRGGGATSQSFSEQN